MSRKVKSETQFFLWSYLRGKKYSESVGCDGNDAVIRAYVKGAFDARRKLRSSPLSQPRKKGGSR